MSEPEQKATIEETPVTPDKPSKPTEERKPEFEAIDISEIF